MGITVEYGKKIKRPRVLATPFGHATNTLEVSVQSQPTPPRPNRPHVSYYAYIASREWGLKKRAVHVRSGGICERCKLAPAVNTHHLTYERLGNELLGDLIDLCEGCHAFTHGHSDIDPKPPEPLSANAWREIASQPWFQRMFGGAA